MTNKTTPRILADLSGSAGRSVLRILLRRHPELTDEAEAAARMLTSNVAPDHIAEDIKDGVWAPGFDVLNAHARRQPWGYVHPADTTLEVLGDLTEMKRLACLGLARAACDTCVGLLLGLYRLREAREEPILEMAPDFCDETVSDILSQCAKTPGPLRGRRELPRELVAEEIPAWSSLMDEVRSTP